IVQSANRPGRVAAGTADGSDARQVQGAGTAHVRADAPGRRKREHRQQIPPLDPDAAASRQRRRPAERRRRRPQDQLRRAASDAAPVEHGARLCRRVVRARRVRRRAPVRGRPAGALLRRQQRLRSRALAGRCGQRALDRHHRAAQARQQVRRLRPADPRLARHRTLHGHDGDRFPGPHRRNGQHRAGAVAGLTRPEIDMDAAPGKLEAIAAYLEQLRTQRQLSPHTCAAYGRDLRELAALTDGLAWPQLRHNDIRRLTAKLHSQGLVARSIARKLSSWRGFFDWLGGLGHVTLAANPVDGVRAPKRAKTLPRALSVDDAVHLVAPSVHPGTAPEPAELCNTAMFELLYSSGLRVSELTGLDARYRKADADGPASLGWVDAANREVLVTGKGNKMRKVPVGAAALAALDAWLAVRPAPSDGSAALFLSARGTRMSPRVVQLRLKAHGQQAGTPVNVHPHMLRHSFASHVLQSSGDLRAVQEMLGHTSITSTQVYTALDFQHLALVYDKAHPRAKIK